MTNPSDLASPLLVSKKYLGIEGLKSLNLGYFLKDMNEPANFVHGSVNGCPMTSSYESPPYKPGNQLALFLL